MTLDPKAVAARLGAERVGQISERDAGVIGMAALAADLQEQLQPAADSQLIEVNPMVTATKAPADIAGLAQWVARKHMFIDSSIQQVCYLPANAPDREIRLLEVTTRFPDKDKLEPVEAIDFKPDVEGVDFALFVADISEQEWDAIRKGDSLLPQGWSLDKAAIFRRGQ